MQLKLLKIVKNCWETMCMGRGSTTTVTNVVYRIYFHFIPKLS